MTRWLCIALALGGCHLAFGLEEVDPLATTVNGTLRFNSVVNDVKHEPMTVEEILAPGTFDLDVYLDNGSQVDVVYRDDGTFSFPIEYPGQRYRVSVNANGFVGDWQHDARRLAIAIQTAGRRDRRPAASSFVQFNFPSPTTGLYAAHLASTGVYTFTSTGLFGAVVNFDWRLSTSLGGPLGFLDASENDLLYALQFQLVPDTTSGDWNKVTAVSQMAITQALGTTAVIPQPAAVTDNTCFRLVSSGDAERSRIESTHPRGYHSSVSDWYALSAPAPGHIGLAGAPHSAAGSRAPARDYDFTRSVHDPFPGTTLVLATGVLQYFRIQLGSADSAEILNSTRGFVIANRAAPPCASVAPSTSDYDVALAGKFSIDGVELENDNQEITLDPTRPPIVTWSYLAPGPADTGAVTLNEIAAINNKTTVIPKWSSAVYGQTAMLDPTQLETGKTYALQVTTGRGRNQAANGDFVPIEFPVYSSVIWTRTFVVRR